MKCLVDIDDNGENDQETRHSARFQPEVLGFSTLDNSIWFAKHKQSSDSMTEFFIFFTFHLSN